MKKYFGTDGVRGEYGKLLTDELARELGYFGTKVLTKNHKPVILIGRDTRESGEPLQTALAQGIIQAGGKVLSAGVIPTPAMAVLVKELNADAAIMISASHNPYQDNGIKFFNENGFKLDDSIEEEIEDLMNESDIELKPIDIEIESVEDPDKIYIDFIKEASNIKDLNGKKIVIDCANGANYIVAPEFFEDFDAEIITIGNNPDGRNINLNYGSTHLETLAQTVLDNQADFGLAFDGDADRLLAVDNKGREMNGDKILYILGNELKKNGNLKDDTIVATTMSNLGLENKLRDEGIKMIRQDVGDRYVLKEMLDHDFNLGGEQSGHIILLDKQTTGDGLLTAAYLADILSHSDMSADAFNDLVPSYPQTIVNVEVEDSKKYSFDQYPEILEAIKETEDFFKETGRVNVRASGTQPLVRIMIEGKNEKDVYEKAEYLKEIIESKLD